jgi:4-hydroxy-tetrahydrodipicolinate reductase
MIKLAITGCLGRMGKRITALAQADEEFTINRLLENPDHPDSNTKVGDIEIKTDPQALIGSDVLIDFTTPEATMANLDVCSENNIKMVIGTTGLTPDHYKSIDAAATKIPIVVSGNMSTGVNLMFKLTDILSQKAPAAYEATFTEAHHVHKKDAPSGTAKMIKEFVDNANAAQDRKRKVHDIESIREGEIIGDHSVVFESPVDTITISHHAKTRDIFAQGALTAARFLMKKVNGRFNMQDVLDLK